MVKIIFLLSLTSLTLWASPLSAKQNTELVKNCLHCHQSKQIPSELIYRRYLMKYSTNTPMQQAIKSYLKHPKKENSIMPPQFFLKFPMREKVFVESEFLNENIRLFLLYFDIKYKLILE